MHEIDERVQIEIGQLETEREYAVETHLARVVLDHFEEFRMQHAGEQAVGHLAEKKLDQRGQVEYGKVGKVVDAFFDLSLKIPKQTFDLFRK